ncbi:hypothetical protein [uncultured Chryseobacterium sp.]|uniref:hypothetical protein n=1 Tax=uncultured Chryseobacterium sp. TaxID=259322 RepID=UPI0025FA4CED|nr:hypothetical protein [uncultured Chryseobacterium sp.]
MIIINKVFDNRIKALNCLIEISIIDYYNLSTQILELNTFQRRRVKSSSTVYSLLKNDILEGCVIPPIVLAHSNFKDDSEVQKLKDDKIKELIDNEKDKLIILDGLQRTYTIKDLIEELKSKEDYKNLDKVSERKIRIEIYLGIDKIGILYRMLTLNTGQTPMSIRHQIEILYSDYLNNPIENITLITETEERKTQNINEYNFKDIVEGFNSYLERDYLTIDRFDILDNIKSLEKLSKENQSQDLFLEFINVYHKLSLFFNEKAEDWIFEENDEKKMSAQPFVRKVEKLFGKSQVMTGFGSAIGKLIDLGALKNLNDLEPLIEKINLENYENSFQELMYSIDIIRVGAKKIGNEQRMFFHFLFRELFDIKGDAYLNFSKSINEAFISYQRKTQ